MAGATRRGLPFLDALFSNNFVIFAFLLSYEHPQYYRSFHLFLGLVILFPLSLDPMRSLPRERLSLLPLTSWDRIRLRLGSLFLSPVLWVAAGLLLFLGPRTLSKLWLVLAVPVLANGCALFLDTLRPGGVHRGRGLGMLSGRLGLLIKKNLREIFCLLDTYLAMSISVLGTLAIAWKPDPKHDLAAPVTFMVVLAVSTSAQQLFALDREAAARYRLLPLRGWEILLAKNIAFLVVLLPLVLFLTPLSGLVAGLCVLAIGNLASTAKAGPQLPWRLVRGASLAYSGGQVLLMALGFTACSELGPWALLPALFLWGGGLVLGGRWFEKRHLG